MQSTIAVVTLLAALAVGTTVFAEEPARSRFERPFERLGRGLQPPWTRRTLGGRMWWTDVFHNHGWRVQKHVVTGHHRLLDPRNVRHASGDLEKCLRTFSATVPVEERLRATPRTVVVVHGLGNWSACLRKHAEHLREEHGYTVVPFDYASNFVRIDDAADNLARVIGSLPPTERIDFVGHSMGGIVVRALLAKYTDPRFGRAVLLGSPNNGAALAEALRGSLIFRATCGPGGRQLAGGPGTFLESLVAPPIEFACIAGGRRDRGYNPFLKGDDDGLVRVSTVRLAGAADFAKVQANHHSLLHDEDVIGMTARFLVSGGLRETGVREPIPRTGIGPLP